MKNKGQVTIFVILGLVILVVVLVLIYISSSALRKEEPLKEAIIEGEVSDAKEYITSCLEDSLKSAVEYCSGTVSKTGSPKCPDYEQNVNNRVKDSFCNCIPRCSDFSALRNIQVEVKGEIRLETKLSEGKKEVTTLMEYPLLVKKGDSEHLLGTTESPFVAKYSLEETACVPIKLKNNDPELCEADEEKTVETMGLILTYKPGDKVMIGGSCIAC